MADTHLDELRTLAQDLVRAGDWGALVPLETRLRADTRWWLTLWAPACAVAAQNLGLPSGRALLAEAIAGGFNQPELLEPLFTEAFGSEPDWPELRAAMAANLPAPTVELLAWPAITPTAPLELFRLPPGREELLRARVPEAGGSSWRTARDLLLWVSTRWVHNNQHVDGEDALTVLDRVAGGERFACREYTIVLTQALNARGLPARQVNIRTATAHTGLGGGHLLSEAWVDELARWVLLDGQNGLYWADGDGTPLGVLDMQARFAAGEARPEAVCLRDPLSDEDLEMWWTFYGEARITGATWSATTVAPMLEGGFERVPRLLRSGAEAYPDLSELAVSFDVLDGEPALRPHTEHPYAIGFRAGDVELPLGGAWPLPRSAAGEHTVELAVVTPYGPLRPRELTYRVN